MLFLLTGSWSSFQTISQDNDIAFMASESKMKSSDGADPLNPPLETSKLGKLESEEEEMFHGEESVSGVPPSASFASPRLPGGSNLEFSSQLSSEYLANNDISTMTTSDAEEQHMSQDQSEIPNTNIVGSADVSAKLQDISQTTSTAGENDNTHQCSLLK